MKKKIAITGGIGSGKSTAAQIIESLGYPVYSCDEIYKDVILSSEYIEQIKKYFPSCVINESIDRKLLSAIVFSNNEKRNILEAIAHPLIMQRLNAQMNMAPADFVFAEVPLLFEGKFESNFDSILIISRSLEDRIESIAERDNLTRDEIAKRIESQFDYSKESLEKLSKEFPITFISNEGDFAKLKENIEIYISNLHHT